MINDISQDLIDTTTSILFEKKDHLIKRLRNLTDEQKQEVIDFFRKKPNLENRIDWNRRDLTYEDFLEVMDPERNMTKSQRRRLVKSSGIRGLKKGEDYIPLEAPEGIDAYIPLNYEASKLIACKDIGSGVGAWCTAWQKSPEHWNRYTDRNNVMIYILYPNTKEAIRYSRSSNSVEEIRDERNDEIAETDIHREILDQNMREIAGADVKRHAPTPEWLKKANTENVSYYVNDEGKLVWESGTWKDGLWKKGDWEDGLWIDGVWERGIWADGIWKGGRFIAGVFKGGTWETGTFGNEEEVSDAKNASFSHNAIWEDGIWLNGKFDAKKWLDGTWYNGKFGANNKFCVWKKGTWYKGKFVDNKWEDGTWHDGTFEGGTWENGTWLFGKFDHGTWEKGTWENGVFRGHWENGTWKDGAFGSGGKNNYSIWDNGIWEDGIFVEGKFNDGTWKGGAWFIGEWDGGQWEGGSIYSKKFGPDIMGRSTDGILDAINNNSELFALTGDLEAISKNTRAFVESIVNPSIFREIEEEVDTIEELEERVAP